MDRKLHYSPVAAARISNACCVLHNIAHPLHSANSRGGSSRAQADRGRQRWRVEGAARRTRSQ